MVTIKANILSFIVFQFSTENGFSSGGGGGVGVGAG